MGRARPLAIDDFVEVLGIAGICRQQDIPSGAARLRLGPWPIFFIIVILAYKHKAKMNSTSRQSLPPESALRPARGCGRLDLALQFGALAKESVDA
jgi:hypothetical protein